MKLVLLATFLAAAIALSTARRDPPPPPPPLGPIPTPPPPPIPRPPQPGCNNGRGCNARGDTAAVCDTTRVPVCKCSIGYIGSECVPAAQQGGQEVISVEKFNDLQKMEEFLKEQRRRCNPHGNSTLPFLCPPPPSTDQRNKEIARLNMSLSVVENELNREVTKVEGRRCQQCTDRTNMCNMRFVIPDSCKLLSPPFGERERGECCGAFLKVGPLRQQRQDYLRRIQQTQAAPPPPASGQIFDLSKADTCVASSALCLNRTSLPNLINSMEQEQKFCHASDMKYCLLIGCVSKTASCVPQSQCPNDKPVRCPAFGASDGSSPCVAIGSPCPSDGLKKNCASGTFPCPSGFTCASGPKDSREFFNKCMGEGNQTKTSTWNGCPPETVACPGRPYVCAPLNGSRTLQQLCEDKPGPFNCPNDQKFCGYRRDAKGGLADGKQIPICLSAGSASCASPDHKPRPSNFTFGLPNAAFSTPETFRGVLPDGSSSRPVAKFGVDRKSGFNSSTPVFFTGDGTQTDKSLSFTVGPIADSVAQFGPFADVVDSGRLLSPIVSITPSEAVVINPEATEMGSGLYLSIPLNDQGDPNDPARRLSNQTNCDRTVANLAVYAIDNEDDNTAEVSARCTGELIEDSGVSLCSCKFLVPHFSAFGVVDTSSSAAPVPSSPPAAPVTPTKSSSPRIFLSIITLAASAVVMF